MTYHLETAGKTHQGLVRETNEDQFLIASLTRRVHVQAASPDLKAAEPIAAPAEDELLVVADGVGGTDAGEVASREAVRGMLDYVQNGMHWHLHDREQHEQELIQEFTQALDYCQKCVIADTRKHPERRGMGTTLTTAYIAWPKAFVLHAGDSRCYRYRNQEISRVTTDHTMAQQMVDAGTLAPEEMAASPWAHYVWNAVGGSDRTLIPELKVVDLILGDVLLLCSDGLTKHVPDIRIARVLESSKTADEACQRLIQDACDAGGTDNVTVVIAKFKPEHHSNHLKAEAATVPLSATSEMGEMSPEFAPAESEWATEVACSST
ncbi:MAG: protein phosphatase 1 [Planctomycetaceae bacterium]|nr:protein phosphatase 1 [Planctomycetaceae bacterium]